jgi:hypothetical protein
MTWIAASFEELNRRWGGLRAEFGDHLNSVVTPRCLEAVLVLEGSANAMRESMPYGICPACGGKRCDVCKGAGWLNHATWRAASVEVMKWSAGQP